jgi:hypothetical protein
MASFICHVVGGTKRVRVERIVRPPAEEPTCLRGGLYDKPGRMTRLRRTRSEVSNGNPVREPAACAANDRG